MQKQRKRLAVVVATMSVGGGQKVILDLLEVTDPQKYEVCLFVHQKRTENQFTKKLDAMGIRVVYIPRTDRITLGNYRGIAKALKAFKPHVVHIHLDSFYAPIWALLHKTTTVFTVHSQARRAFYNGFLRWLHRRLAKKKGHRITAVSRNIAQETESLLGLAPGTVAPICNPVHMPEAFERTAAGQLRFVHVARFNPVKNHRLLLEAFAQVVSRRDDCVLSLAGDGALLESCKAYAGELGLDQRVRFLGNVTDVSGLLKNSDVFVLSSDSEAMPVSILEAMAHGLPIAATNVGGVPELVDGNGILTPKGDAQALATAMLELASNARKREEMAKCSWERAQYYRAEEIFAQYEKLYD